MAQARTAAASTSSSGVSPLARMLRQTRLITHDPSIAQVYTTPKANAVRGDWGLKLPIPPILPLGKLRYINLSSLESLAGHVPWEERERGPLLRQRWHDAPVRSPSAQQDSKVVYGPRIITYFDASTARPLETTLRESLAVRKAEIPIPVLTNEQKKDKSLVDPEVLAERRQALQAHGQLNRYVKRQAHLARYGLSSEVQADGIGPSSSRSAGDPLGNAASHYTTSASLLPNYNTMSERQFSRYLRTVRASRNTLRKIAAADATARLRSLERLAQGALRDQALTSLAKAKAMGDVEPEVISVADIEARVRAIQTDPLSVDLWDVSRQNSTAAADLRRAQRTKRASSRSFQGLPDSSVVADAGTAHPAGGLAYSQPDTIYSSRLAEPQPGRILQSTNRKAGGRTTNNTYVVGFGGRAGHMQHVDAEDVRPLDFSRTRPEVGSSVFRPQEARHPDTHGDYQSSVVGKGQVQDAPPTRVSMRLSVVKESDTRMLPPANVLPGTPEWVGSHDETRVARDLGSSTAARPVMDFASTPRGASLSAKEREKAAIRRKSLAAAGARANLVPMSRRRADRSRSEEADEKMVQLLKS